MRFEQVTAHAFGALNGPTLELQPGLNVIWGPNEAGKSTWHAAIYAALCGVRRGRGGTKEAQEFATKHRPWDGQSWEVSTIITLEDGRRVELRHDLAGKVASRASDADMGRDYSDQIIVDGAPDGSHWLGFDRRSFLATACVKQTDLLGVLDDANALQDHLQRAASSGAADATAAAALSRLVKFRGDAVGTNRSNSVKPLRQALDRVSNAGVQLQVAQREHQQFLELASLIEAQENALARAQSELTAAQAAGIAAELQDLRERLAAAREIQARFPDGAGGMTADNYEREMAVSGAVRSWRELPPVPTLEGRSAVELEEDLDQLELEASAPPPSGDSYRRVVPIAIGAVAAILGLVAVILASLLVGGVLIMAGVAVAVWGFLQRPPDMSAPLAAREAREERRRSLQVQLDVRRQQEQEAIQTEQRRASSLAALREHALTCGIDGADPGPMIEAMEAWLTAARQRVLSAQRSAKEYAQLVQVQGNLSLEALEHAVGQHEEQLQVLGLSVAELPTLATRGVPQVQADVAEVAGRLNQLQGQRQQMSTLATSVAEAEELLAAAQAELERVQRLDRTLEVTHRLLSQAQERVHRSIAPVLAASLRDHLAVVTGGRYTDARVDPASLMVTVLDQGGQWRDASGLSHGTAEQIYLLLRVALAEHLTKAGEICPLILDDVTAHCDETRTLAVLETLLALSAKRQVILFSQETMVRDWATSQAPGADVNVIPLSGALAAA